MGGTGGACYGIIAKGKRELLWIQVLTYIFFRMGVMQGFRATCATSATLLGG